MDLKRNRLSKKLAELEKLYGLEVSKLEAAYQQLGSTLDRANQVIIKQQIEQIEARMKEIEGNYESAEKELRRHDSQLGDPNRDHLDFEGEIHKIDYTEVREAITRLIERAQQDCAASLFLLQGSNAFGGNWCLDAIRAELRQGSGKAITPRRVGFRRDERKDRLALLDRIAGHFNVQKPATGEDASSDYARAIAGKIAATTHIGSTELIEIHGWDYLQKQPGLLEWFLREFWGPLLRDFRVHDKRKNAKLIIVLVADGPSPEDLLREHCCDEENFEEEKLLPLTLRNWHRREIEAFLSSGIVNWAGPKTIEELTDMIYGFSEGGMPRLAYEALRKHVFNEV